MYSHMMQWVGSHQHSLVGPCRTALRCNEQQGLGFVHVQLAWLGRALAQHMTAITAPGMNGRPQIDNCDCLGPMAFGAQS